MEMKNQPIPGFSTDYFDTWIDSQFYAIRPKK